MDWLTQPEPSWLVVIVLVILLARVEFHRH